ncbi:TonB-dependent receptor [Sphingomonas sp. G-3-2-10]|uniref:TonB-dependent receptor domain-containing protein n=1 Tax=Sphingomonas sp. G-3-2-10 TaxID=2728838 RepID=UPI00146C7104|nr:TonB-dependent receptor [Sphingomonas sp. G-3-2-10]NML04471.1 TonB-dependent receptor [Sphingomonas sp. G-3-2-10]
MRTIHQLLSATALATAILLPGVAQAQDAPAADETEAAPQDEAPIIVTGSRIARPGLTSVVPVTTMQVSELTDTGNVSLGDALNNLPSMHATFSQANSGGFIGTAGLSLLDLRGLGTARTLVLVNGRRHVTAQPGTPTSVDVNTIPVDLLERVDVVTGGNSAIYGSDAVAGVVNFVTKRNFEGFRFRAQAGASGRGDRGSYLLSATAGKNFSEGRGNIAASLEYSYADDVYYTDRDDLYGAYSGRPQFNAVQNTLGEGAAGDGIPDNAFLRGVRNGNISEGGTYAAACPAAVPAGDPNFAAVQARRALNCTGERSNTGAELGVNFHFDGNGNLNPNNCVRDLRPVGSNNCIGGQGSTLRLTGQLLPRLERKSANMLASYEFSPAFRAFFEGKFVRIDGNQEGQPTSIANLQGTYSINNPFLTTQARNVLTRSLAPGATTFSIQRFNVDFGGRGEQYRRDTFRLVGGFDGVFNDDWRYEVAVNYGQTDTHFDATNRILLQNFRNAADAVLSGGQIVCAINADANPNNNDAACVPINVFGNGKPSQAALDYVSADVYRDERATFFGASAFVSGDLSQLFELPGGPIAFAIGGEYRAETARSLYDPITASGATDFNVILPFVSPTLKVKEAYGEVRIPLLKGITGIEELSIEGAARISSYNGGAGSTGDVWTYNFGGVYSPVPGVRFRGGYARSVRAPTLVNLYRPASQTFLNGLIDPCSQTNINNGTSHRVANCAAAGVPTSEIIAGVSVPWTNVPSSGIRGLNGSNSNLEEERGTSITIGAVFQPRFLPGFSLTVDYYDIKVENVIFSLGAQTVIDLCYDNPSGISNQYCAAVFRRPDGTFLGQSNRNVGGSTVQYTVGANDNSFVSGPFNFARLETSGIDFDATYQTRLLGGDLNLRGVFSWLLKRDSYSNVNDPTFRDRAKGELNEPEYAASLEANLDFGKFDLNYNLRYITGMTVDFYETQHPLDGRPATDLDKFPVVWTPDTFYHSFRLGFEPVKSYRFYVGVDNLFDTAPPFGFDGTCGTGGVFSCGSGGTGTAVYENVGRFFYAGAVIKF